MFTGIIEKTGKIIDIKTRGEGKEIKVKIEGFNLKRGDSVSIDGVCLTVEEIKGNEYLFYLSKKTLKDTKFGKKLERGMIVNIEESLTFSKKIGGHLIEGHVDFFTKIKNIKKIKEEFEFSFELKKEFKDYIFKKSSIAIDGVSLTVQDVVENFFKVMIIPYTYNNTNFKFKKVGDYVNVECDFLIKGVINYIKGLLSFKNFKKT